ncbi:hypothetical protein M758_UG197000 [Ceratodon purpureus]|nr:hypothetical protein M758_UG197000 [Ceratodon purpureus]
MEQYLPHLKGKLLQTTLGPNSKDVHEFGGLPLSTPLNRTPSRYVFATVMHFKNLALNHVARHRRRTRLSRPSFVKTL